MFWESLKLCALTSLINESFLLNESTAEFIDLVVFRAAESSSESANPVESELYIGR